MAASRASSTWRNISTSRRCGSRPVEITDRSWCYCAMVRRNEIRAGEVAIEAPAATDAGLVFIGRIHTPWTDRLECPRQGRADGPTCRIEVFPPWIAALDSIAQFERLEVLYWLHLSRRDLVLQSPASDGSARGTFSLRSPARPNPIGSSIVRLVRVEAD